MEPFNFAWSKIELFDEETFDHLTAYKQLNCL